MTSAVGGCRYARQMTRIGAHLHDGDPLAQAKAIGSDAVQFFLGDPQGWKAPKPYLRIVPQPK